MNKINKTYRYNSTLHLCLLFFAIIPVTKMVSLPCFLSEFCGRSLWISGIISTIIDTCLALYMAYLRHKMQKPVSQLLEETLGKTATKILFIIYSLLFISRSLIFVSGEKYFIETTYYEETAFGFVFIPFFLIVFYFCIKGLKPYERLSLFLVIFTVMGIALIIFLSVGEMRINFILPIKPTPLKGILKGSLFNFTFGGEGIYLLFFTGKPNTEKKPVFYLVISFLSAYTLIIVFFVFFYATFGPIAQTKLFAMAQMAHYSDILSGVGRVDTIAVFMIDFVRLFALTLPLSVSAEMLKYVFGENKKTNFTIAGVIAIICFVFTHFFGTQFIHWFNVFYKFVLPFFIFFVYFLPLFLFILIKKANEKPNGVLEKK